MKKIVTTYYFFFSFIYFELNKNIFSFCCIFFVFFFSTSLPILLILTLTPILIPTLTLALTPFLTYTAPLTQLLHPTPDTHQSTTFISQRSFICTHQDLNLYSLDFKSTITTTRPHKQSMQVLKYFLFLPLVRKNSSYLVSTF